MRSKLIEARPTDSGSDESARISHASVAEPQSNRPEVLVKITRRTWKPATKFPAPSGWA